MAWQFATRIGAIRANRFAPMVRRKTPIFITCERFARIASNWQFAIFGPRSAIHKKGVQFGKPETIRENQAIHANLRMLMLAPTAFLESLGFDAYTAGPNYPEKTKACQQPMSDNCATTNWSQPWSSGHVCCFWLSPLIRAAKTCKGVLVKFLVKFDLEFDLKFEISDGKNLVKFWGRTFRLPGKHGKFRGEFRGKYRSKFQTKFQKLRFKFRAFCRKLRSAEGRC